MEESERKFNVIYLVKEILDSNWAVVHETLLVDVLDKIPLSKVEVSSPNVLPSGARFFKVSIPESSPYFNRSL